jgi:anti-sigma factor RsiW
MNPEMEIKSSICLTDELSAYLDGELSATQEAKVEGHLSECPGCSEKLNDQKRLMSLLTGTFTDERLPEPPANFVKRVSVFAESRMEDIRLPAELGVAVLIMLLLAGFSVVAMGVAPSALLTSAASFFEKGVTLFSVVAAVLYNVAFAIVRAAKAVSHGLSLELFSSAVLGAFSIIGLASVWYVANLRRNQSSKA